MSINVYLCGGINGLSDSQCKDWREQVKESLNKEEFECLDPMRRDYRGIEENNESEIVKNDIEDINNSDIVLVMGNTPSWGTAMEVFYAYTQKKTVFTICDKDRPSPLLKYHSNALFKDLESAIESIIKLKALIRRMEKFISRTKEIMSIL